MEINTYAFEIPVLRAESRVIATAATFFTATATAVLDNADYLAFDGELLTFGGDPLVWSS